LPKFDRSGVALDDLRQRRTGRLRAQLHLIEREFGVTFERSGLGIAGCGIEGRQTGPKDNPLATTTG
jgi:hypothetical protein